VAAIFLLFFTRIFAQTITIANAGQIDSLSQGYTYTLCIDDERLSTLCNVVPQFTGEEFGADVWLQIHTKSDSSTTIQFTLPTKLQGAGNTSLLCSFNSVSCFDLGRGQYFDPNTQFVATPRDSLIDFLLGTTVAVPSNALPGSYYGTIVCRMVSPDTASATMQFEASVIHIVNGVPLPKALPSSFGLAQNYPNPFNPGTIIGYNLPKSSHVMLTVYNMLGQQIATLIDGYQEAGYKSAKFEVGNIPSGVYIYRLTAGTYTDIKKMILIR
jgi:hypothetical protein